MVCEASAVHHAHPAAAIAAPLSSPPDSCRAIFQWHRTPVCNVKKKRGGDQKEGTGTEVAVNPFCGFVLQSLVQGLRAIDF